VIHLTHLWSVVVIAATLAAVALRRRLGGRAAANPVLLASASVLLAILVANVSRAHFTQGTRPLRNLLAPATVALAVPLAHQLRNGGRRARRDALAAALGGFFVAALAGLIGALAGRDVAVTMATKSVTTAVGVPIVAAADGPVELAAAAIVVTGVVTAVIGSAVLRRVSALVRAGERNARAENPRARAVAMGTTGHAIATAEVLRRTPEHGGAAVLALIVNGITTALWLPFVLRLLR
jgi:putative effector of murein hydrolase